MIPNSSIMESYETKGTTILHLPEITKFFQHICETFNENHRTKLPHPHLQVRL